MNIKTKSGDVVRAWKSAHDKRMFFLGIEFKSSGDTGTYLTHPQRRKLAAALLDGLPNMKKPSSCR